MPDGTMTITLDEKQRCDIIEDRILRYLKNQITHFRYCFPFGRPKGGLKSTLAFLGRVRNINYRNHLFFGFIFLAVIFQLFIFCREDTSY